MLHLKIKLARQHAKLTQQQVGDRLGVSKASVAQWEARDEQQRTKPAIANLVRFADLTGAPLWWLLSEDTLRESDFVRVPSDGDYGALPLAQTCDEIRGARPCDILSQPPITKDAIAVPCPDGAMAPEIQPGDILICRHGQLRQDAICVATYDELVLVRRYRDTGAARLLVSASADFPPLDATHADVILPAIEVRRLLA